MSARVLSSLALLLLAAPALALDPGAGKFKFDPCDDEKCGVAARYRMPAREFDFKLSKRHDLKTTGVRVYDLTFSSPVKTAVPENNTVHCELFLPPGDGPFPAVVVLDILQGNALIARGQCMWLAQHGVVGLVVYMSHYGPRRAPGGKERMLSTDVFKSIDNVKQSVLDIRCAVAWLAGRPEFDREKLGLAGTSLGSLVGAVVAANEPRLKNVCLMLTGGGLVDAFYDHPQAAPYRSIVDVLGGKFTLKLVIDPVDPLTYAKQLKDKNLLMICAGRDDIIPPAAAKLLWEKTGKQKIVWFDCTHVGAVVFLMPLLMEMGEHLKGK